MNRDSKFLRPSSKQVKGDSEIENVPVNTRDSISTASQASTDSFSRRPPLNAILDPKEPPTARTKFDRTPTKPKTESSHLRTPDKHGKRINWAHKNDLLDDVQMTRAGLPSVTPKSYRTSQRTYTESNSTQNTPTKSVVSKPHASGFKSNVRVGNVSALYRGVSVSGGWSNSTVINTAEVPHFELKEDPSFWVDHNVQVLIRVRPLNSIEKNLHGHHRCLKQETPQCITWIGQPETRFSFDHVACESVDQEMLFRLAGLPMVENCLAGYNSCIFAYGQTGSGKTYTMLGEIDDLEVNPSPERGMTPRIFEFLFARIQAEEEIRRDERLKYNCKCSFLEIYNEQITDLLDPSSNNLHLREDAKKGVYVENLSEFEVYSVNDILKLLSQGSLNRKVAATNMNRESSRSHCVFTCVIESKWEKDSTTNLRFARLNLVDLAGSERQKHSGAEGERLKEAASINKSLSTLGHVIMILVDVAQGKSRHIPYRDSRLTFLLQDSLGGNSKTMIIANVSPSICCTAETLNTLKFAQRAKFIQNNAVVNEDSSGDILALQHQVRLLEEELAVLKRQNISRSLSFGRSVHEEEMQLDNCPERVHETDGWKVDDVLANDFKDIVRIPTKQLKSLETILAGALRREKMAETSIKKLEAEIGQLNRLVRQKEEDNRSTKMMLRFREDKIQRMESLFGGNLAPDNYLLDENKALCKEIQLLQSKVDKNPEVTRFALENIRLLEQLRRFQDFYEEGEREILLDELSALRDQLFCSLEADILQCNKVNASCQSQDSTKTSTLESSTLKETQSDVEGMRCPSDLKQAEEVLDLQLELDIMKVILKEERLTRSELGERATSLSRDLDLVRAELMSVCRQNDDTANKLKEAKSVIEALESEQIIAINEMEDLRNASDHYSKLLSEKEQEILTLKEQYYELRDKNCGHQDGESILQRKLKRMQESFERLNLCYKNDSASKLSKEGLDEVRVQAEAEAAEVIICMQEELSILQHQVQEFHMKEKENEEVMKLGKSELKELQDKIDILNIDNNCMKEELEKRDEELRKYNEEWDSLAREIEEVLGDGQEALTDANNQVCLISSSFAQNRNLISKQIGKLIENITEKELMIENLGKCLESANHKSNSVERMINSLRRAAVVINEAHQQECIEKEEEILLLKSNIDELEEKVKLAQNRAVKVLVFATVICLSFKRVSEKNLGDLQDRSYGGNQSSEAAEIRKEDLYPTTKEGQGVETKTKQVEENGISERRNVLEALEGGGVSIDSVLDLRIHDSKMASGACLNSPGMASEDACPEDMPISLLKKEIDSALQSFQEVQVEVAKLWKQTGETLMSSDGQNEERIGHFSTQSLAFEEVMSNFGKQLEQKIKVVHNRLQTCEQGLQESETCCHHEKEVLFLEASDAKIVAAQKEAEASSIFSKFEEAQLTMKEADMMINELMIDNKSMKLDIERLKEVEETLSNERDVLVNEVQSLHALNVQKDQQFEELEIEFRSSLTSVLSLVTEMQSSFLKLQTSFEENFTSLQSDIHCLKIHASDSSKLTRSWLEDVCSEIIMKDCAVSALHLCYMGILLETVAGMHAENSLLQEGLVESNSVVADLKEQNSKSSNELQTFRSLKCKLLSDIKNSFDQLSRKEEDTEELSAKLNTFEKKVFDLQFLEEVMVERANSIGTELANLVNELHSSNKNIVESLLDKEKMLKDKEVSDSQTKLLVDWHAKDLESFLLASHLKEIAVQKSAAERRLESYHSLLDYIKEETILSKIESESREVLLVEAAEVAGVLINQVQELEGKLNRLQNDLKIKDDTLEEMGVQITVLEKEHLQFGAVLENLKKDMFLLTVIGELKEQLLLDTEGKVDLLECKLEEAQRGMKDMCSRMLNCDEERRALERERKLFTDVADSNNRLKSDLDEVIEINMRLEIAVQALEAECRKMLKDLKEMALDISSGQLFATEQQNEKLQDIYSLESSFRKLQNELLTKSVEINRLSCLEEEIISLKDEACRVSTENRVITRDMEDKNAKIESLLNRIQVANMDICQLKETIMSLETLVSSLQTDLESKNAEMTKLQQSQSIIMADLCSKRQDLDTFVGEVHKLKEENILLRNQLQSCNDMREVITRSSISTEKCFNLAENVHSVGHRLFNDLERETSVTSERYFSELNGIIDSTSKFLQEFSYLERTAKELDSDKAALQAELLKKDDILKGLLFDLSLLQESASNHKDQKDKLRMMQASMEVLEDELAVKTGQLLEAAAYSQKLEAQLQEKVEAVSILESDLARECESLKACSSENHELRAQMEEVLTSRCYLEETLTVKEAEIQLLEKSVEELEHAVDVLENKVDVLNEEAERQRLRREELEAEVSAISLQMQSVRNADTDMKRRLDEKEKSLEEVLEHAKILERDVLDKDAEISNFKAHVAELNLHAEAQATEYKQKFKALEAMVEQVKTEGQLYHTANSSSGKEKLVANTKPRGSGSPFKCIGLGLAQQIKSERDEELSAARLRIEELECLAASRQKEIFHLHKRLATAESMTHDVIRDLLGVKLDMTNFASLMDIKQVKKIAETAEIDNSEPKAKDMEAVRRKQKLNELIEDRSRLLEEIDQKNAELLAAQIEVEELHQRNQLVKTENEMFKMENLSHKQKVMELEEEVKALSGQQNMQQRIHHHAKIKEENLLLKAENEKLRDRQQRLKEVSQFRRSVGRRHSINFNEERLLMNKLKTSSHLSGTNLFLS